MPTEDDDSSNWPLALVCLLSSGVATLLVCSYWLKRLCPNRFKELDEVSDDFTPPVELSASVSYQVEAPIVFDPLPDVQYLLEKPAGIARPSLFCIVKEDLPPFNPTSSKLTWDRRRIRFVRQLGQGSLTQVLEAQSTTMLDRADNNKPLKLTIRCLREGASPSDKGAIVKHCIPWRDFGGHPNVMKLLGHCLSDMPYLFIFPHFPNGDLKWFVRTHRSDTWLFNSKLLHLQFGADIAAAMTYLHSNNFLHSDLAARNCQVRNDYSAVVGDFGLARQFYPEDYVDLGDVLGSVPIRWTAPELFEWAADGSLEEHNPPNTASNVWSYGCFMWEILSRGEQPFAALSDAEVQEQVLRQRQSSFQLHDTEELAYSRVLVPLVERCCATDPRQRSTMWEMSEMLRMLRGQAEVSRAREQLNQLPDTFRCAPPVPAQVTPVRPPNAVYIEPDTGVTMNTPVQNPQVTRRDSNGSNHSADSLTGEFARTSSARRRPLVFRTVFGDEEDDDGAETA